jgi:AraC-like DNA-binding protein
MKAIIRRLTIEEIADYVGLDRNYLGSIFKKHLNTTMQEFLIDFRMKKACGLLKNEDITIADVVRSVGYQDQLQFSKVFKSRKTLSLLNYRNMLKNNDFTS